MTKERFKVVETIINDDRRIYELTKNDVGYYNFRSEKLLAHIICNKLNKLLEENERLKSILRIYREIANCRNCDYHDYDCRSDGDDFEICEKGHDMSENICKGWREL